jgi:hypothetical protein
MTPAISIAGLTRRYRDQPVTATDADFGARSRSG